MFTDYQDELIVYLGAQTGPNKNLQGFDKIAFSGAPVPAQYFNVIKVDWDNEFEVAFGQSGVEMRARFGICVLTTHTLGEKEADRKLQDLLLRFEGGKWRGVIPCLLQAGAIKSDATGIYYTTKIAPKLIRGVKKDTAVFKAGAWLVLDVTAHAHPTDFLE